MSSEEPGSLADQAAAWVPPWARSGAPTPSEATAPEVPREPAPEGRPAGGGAVSASDAPASQASSEGDLASGDAPVVDESLATGDPVPADGEDGDPAAVV